MPTYCYSNEDGDSEQKFYQMGEAPDSITINGKVAKRDFGIEQGGRHRGGEGYPFINRALSCHPSQREEYMKECRKRGVPTHYDKTGGCKIEDAGHYKKLRKAFGYRDMSSYTE